MGILEQHVRLEAQVETVATTIFEGMRYEYDIRFPWQRVA